MMEGSLTLWLPDVWPLQKHRHPWGRTYREGKLARYVLDIRETLPPARESTCLKRECSRDTIVPIRRRDGLRFQFTNTLTRKNAVAARESLLLLLQPAPYRGRVFH